MHTPVLGVPSLLDLLPRAVSIPAPVIPMYVYVLRLADRTYYVGQTISLMRRLQSHACRVGCSRTRLSAPVAIDALYMAHLRKSEWRFLNLFETYVACHYGKVHGPENVFGGLHGKRGHRRRAKNCCHFDEVVWIHFAIGAGHHIVRRFRWIDPDPYAPCLRPSRWTHPGPRSHASHGLKNHAA